MSDSLSGGLVLGVAGAAVGAFFGFPGLGFAVGSAVGGLLFPPENRLPDVTGPRLNDLRVQASTYGLAIPEIWGSYRLAGNIIWSIPIQERTNTETVETGGKGGGPSATQDRTTYSYDVSFAVGLTVGPCDGVGRIWADGKLIWDFRAQGTDPEDLLAELNAISNSSGLVGEIRFYSGDETQEADTLIESFEGAGNVPGFRGLCYVVFDTLQLQKFGNRIPNLEFEVIRSGTFTTGLRCAQLPTIFDTTVDSGNRVSYSLQARPNGRFPDRNIPRNTVGSQGYLRAVGDGMGGTLGHEFSEYIHTINGNLVSEDRWQLTTAQLPSFARWVCPIHGLHGERAFIYDTGGAESISQHVLVFGETAVNLPIISFGQIRVDGAYWDATVNKLFVSAHLFTGGLGSTVHLLRYGWNPITGNPATIVGEERVQLTSLERMYQGWSPKPWRDSIVCGVNYTGTNGRLYIYNKLDFTIDNGEFLQAAPQGQVEFDVFGDEIWGNFGNPSVAETSPNNPSTCDPGDYLVQTVYNFKYSDSNNRWEHPNGEPLSSTTGDGYFQCVAPPILESRQCPEGGTYGLVIASFDPLILVGLKHSTNYAVSDSPGTQVWYQNPGNGSQTYRRAFYFSSGIEAGTFTLSEIVTDLCEDVGLDSLDLDVSELTDTVPGFARTREGAARNSIAALQSAYFFDGLESDFILKFPKRGRSVTATVAPEQLAGHEPGQENPDEVEPRITQELEMPREITVKHIDQDKAYQQGFQYQRRLITESNIVDNVDLPIVLTPDEARQSCEVLLYNQWQQRTIYTLRLPRDFAAVDPTDVIDVQDSEGETYRFRVLATDYSIPLLIQMECAPEDSGIYTSTIAGGTAPEDDQTIFIPLDTQFINLDVPLLNVDTDTPGQYIGVYPAGIGTWGGASTYRSYDGGDTFNFVVTGVASARISQCETVLASPVLTTMWDEINTLTVQVTAGDPPESRTRDQVLNGANVAVVGSETTFWEVIQWTTVVDNGDGNYTLSDFLRGRRGTDWAVGLHSGGENFVILDNATTLDFPNTEANIGQDQETRAVSTGGQLQTASGRNYAPDSVRLIPFSPVEIKGVREVSADITLTWTRRDRRSFGWFNGSNAPLSEESLLFEIDIIDPAGPTVVRTVTGITVETYTYTIADQTTDFGGPATNFDVEIFQISATVGRGYPGQANIQV